MATAVCTRCRATLTYIARMRHTRRFWMPCGHCGGKFERIKRKTKRTSR